MKKYFGNSSIARHVSVAVVRPMVVAVALMASGFTWASDPVNINSADANTIAEALQGIGPVKAQAIVDYRAANGDFKSVEELKLIAGIGDALLMQIQPFLIIDVAGQKASGARGSQSSNAAGQAGSEVIQGDPESAVAARSSGG